MIEGAVDFPFLKCHLLSELEMKQWVKRLQGINIKFDLYL